MARFLKTKVENIGLSPDAMLFRGEKKSDTVLLRILDFDTDQLEELVLKSVKEAAEYMKKPSTTWFNVDGLHDESMMEEISREFDLDTRILSDVMNTHARPKIVEYDNCIYVSVKMLQYDDLENQVTSENLVIIIHDKLLISFQEIRGDVFEPVRERIRKNKKRIRSSGTDYLAYALIDIVFDNYSYIISRIGEKIELLEERILNHPPASIIEEINDFKREIIYLTKSIKPCHELIIQLYKIDSDLIEDDTFIHIKDLQSNIYQAIESLENYREILSDQLNIFHSTMSSKLNYIMKFLTIFSVIFIPLTFIAGIYGTNFDNIPELHFKNSYFIMLSGMLLIVVSMIIYFKIKKWF